MRPLGMIAIVAVLTFGTSCSPTPIADPTRLTLQANDLPDGTKESGKFVKITPENMKSLHSKKEISDLVLQELEKLDFESLVTRTYELPDGREIASQIFVFKDDKAAADYFRKNPPDFPGKDTPLLGDESFTEAILPPQSNDPEAAALQTIRTRIRLGRIISDFSESGPELDRDAHLKVAKKAEARLKAADQ